MSKSILVVDDEPMTRTLLRMMLAPANFQVFEAEDGADAIEKVREHMPDIIIMDVMMPNMNGLDACQVIRSDETISHIPILILSAKTHPKAVEEGLEAGATRYLTKPVSRVVLLQHVQEVLSALELSS